MRSTFAFHLARATGADAHDPRGLGCLGPYMNQEAPPLYDRWFTFQFVFHNYKIVSLERPAISRKLFTSTRPGNIIELEYGGKFTCA